MPYLTSIVEASSDVHSKLTYGLIAMLLASLAHYAITVAQYNSADRITSDNKVPPVAPHFIPFLGSIPWQYFTSPIQFFRSR
jgi:hypothetical protein